MGDWWANLTLVQQILAFAAIPATVILILQTIFLLFGLGHGGGSDTDSDADCDADCDGDCDGGCGGSTDYDDSGDISDGIAGLRLFTIRGIVAFFAVGGWFGILLVDLGASTLLAVLGTVVVGTIATVLVALVMKWAMKLQDNGNLSIETAIGKSATVYLTIPANAERTGKVSIELQGRLTELEALTKETEPIRTGQLVQVVDVINGNTLLVEELSNSSL